jgi:hypothetical protein
MMPRAVLAPVVRHKSREASQPAQEEGMFDGPAGG